MSLLQKISNLWFYSPVVRKIRHRFKSFFERSSFYKSHFLYNATFTKKANKSNQVTFSLLIIELNSTKQILYAFNIFHNLQYNFFFTSSILLFYMCIENKNQNNQSPHHTHTLTDSLHLESVMLSDQGTDIILSRKHLGEKK